jgi:glycine/D-amino acid oxidase-like deaminating enzyme
MRGPAASTTTTGAVWFDTLEAGDDASVRRPPLPGDADVDVAVVGAGYTGLWTAYHLAKADPGLRIVVVERESAGFGASGRNGGWCSGLLPVSWDRLARHAQRDRVVALQRALHGAVDEVGRTAAAEGIDAHFAKGGYVRLATLPAHVRRLHADLEEHRAWGFGEDDLRWMGRDEAGAAVAATGVLGATYTPHCAAVHPARLVRGLARAVERLGVPIHEGTRVLELEPGVVDTDHGRVRAEVVVRATEGYTATISAHRRELVPLYSLMVATEPLSDAVWDAIGLRQRQTFNDARHLIVYGQRTADGRLAFGGRGAPTTGAPGFGRPSSTTHRSTMRSGGRRWSCSPCSTG